MARIPRVVVPGIPHHIIQSGNRRQPVFFCDADYELYLGLMAEWCRKYRVDIRAYCLMTDHVQLVAVPKTRSGLARAVGEVHRRYTLLVNRREQWGGYLWQGRFGSYPLDKPYLLAAVRYVELDPVRSGLVKRAWRYQWSSAGAHRRGEDDRLVRVGPTLKLAGEDWRKHLGRSVSAGDAELLELHLRTGRPLGSAKFIKGIEQSLGRKLGLGRRGRPRKNPEK